jgi:hypothetical protein
MPDKENKITVIAQLEVTDHLGESHTVRGFDNAWHIVRSLARTGTPVKSRLLGFVRKD